MSVKKKKMKQTNKKPKFHTGVVTQGSAASVSILTVRPSCGPSLLRPASFFVAMFSQRAEGEESGGPEDRKPELGKTHRKTNFPWPRRGAL